ncbi:class I mannose-6-phosphate isomerase [Virgibacillus necropolis]|uniref:Mannose-6-phosphate isomerase n=1 Tax=Virgibacillus necropolis TaxID=163877 RepID=A0A221MDH0_9BACI|nr:class I mannose-6-phosphate isomerase [Virgibacillus necropolis]ASN05650.1 mannose-6-phosphate isomerase [Virgibacillus necropolis]
MNNKIDTLKANVITIECYPTINEEELMNKIIAPLNPSLMIDASELFYGVKKINNMIERNITDDRIFGLMSHHSLSDFIDPQHANILEKEINLKLHNNERVIIYGVGASLVYPADLLIYADLSRWEVQTRYRSGKYSNWQADNAGEDSLRMIKRGYFFEWRVADKLKKVLFNKIDYFLDTHIEGKPKLIDGKSYKEAMSQITKQPFSLVPFFDPGIWGGNWMQEKFNFRREEINLAWSFNGVPEENSLILNFDGVKMEVPANNLVFTQPLALLGERVCGRFGAEFPIRFNFLDTIGGSNLSLQVHPKTDYVQEVFGANYTQDESYYILEAHDHAKIYLGVKNGVGKEELMTQLKIAANGEGTFPDKELIYQQVVKKHDHYSIPGGTIHSSGANSVVLEISSTPNRYTFKLWDWDRVDLDGLPRPVHLNHGEPNIDITRDEDWVKKELVNPFEVINEAPGWQEERTGLHESEFIETRRHTFSVPVMHENHGSVNVFNLVEGEEAIVESMDHSFAPFIVHYAQTFIIPEQIKEYKISPYGKSLGQTIMTIKAFVR